MGICFDCPYTRDAEPLGLTNEQCHDYLEKHILADGPQEEVICEEQGCICGGQIQMIANSINDPVDPFSELGEAADNTPRNIKDFLQGAWEFISFHGI